MSENRAKSIENQKARIRDYLKQLGVIIKQQKDIQGRTTGGDDAKRLAGQQAKVADKTGGLAKTIRENEEKAEGGEAEGGGGRIARQTEEGRGQTRRRSASTGPTATAGRRGAERRRPAGRAVAESGPQTPRGRPAADGGGGKEAERGPTSGRRRKTGGGHPGAGEGQGRARGNPPPTPRGGGRADAGDARGPLPQDAANGGGSVRRHGAVGQGAAARADPQPRDRGQPLKRQAVANRRRSGQGRAVAARGRQRGGVS